MRLEMAADRLAHQLLKMTTDPNVADPVKLAAIKDALDRSGIQAKTAVSVEVSTKPFELAFERIAAGPRNESRSESVPEIEAQPALAIEGEIVEDEPEVIDPDDGDPSFGLDAVEIVADEYTDAIMSDGSGNCLSRSRSNRPQRRSGLHTGAAGSVWSGGFWANESRRRR